MNFFKFLLYSSFIILLYMRLKSGPYIFQSSKKHIINIIKHNFDNNNINIKRGDTLIFINKDQIRHTIKTNNQFIPNSPILFQNDIWEITLDTDFKNVIFEFLYDNMNQVNVKILDIFKDNSTKNQFRNNLLNIKKQINKIFDYIKNIVIKKK